MFTIPYLGYVADYIQHPPGMYVAISAGAILLLLVFLPDLFADDGKAKGEPAKADAPRRFKCRRQTGRTKRRIRRIHRRQTAITARIPFHPIPSRVSVGESRRVKINPYH